MKLAERREVSPDQVRAIEMLKDSTGSWVLMGSAADGVSYEATRYGQGVLTYALLRGFRGEALEDGGRVEVGRLFQFAQRLTEDLAREIGGSQRPVISSPKSRTFPIGLLGQVERAQIPLAAVKPRVLRASAQDTSLLDPLNLTPVLRAALRAAGFSPSAEKDMRGPAFDYLDNVVDDVPGAIIPRVQYTRTEDGLQLKLVLVRDNKVVLERAIRVAGTDPNIAAAALVPAIAEGMGSAFPE
jgi:hypothetical protein